MLSRDKHYLKPITIQTVVVSIWSNYHKINVWCYLFGAYLSNWTATSFISWKLQDASRVQYSGKVLSSIASFFLLISLFKTGQVHFQTNIVHIFDFKIFKIFPNKFAMDVSNLLAFEIFLTIRPFLISCFWIFFNGKCPLGGDNPPPPQKQNKTKQFIFQTFNIYVYK